jgi:hypothetical protein
VDTPQAREAQNFGSARKWWSAPATKVVTGKVNSQAMMMREIIPYRAPAPDGTIVSVIPEVTICVVLTAIP